MWEDVRCGMWEDVGRCGMWDAGCEMWRGLVKGFRSRLGNACESLTACANVPDCRHARPLSGCSQRVKCRCGTFQQVIYLTCWSFAFRLCRRIERVRSGEAESGSREREESHLSARATIAIPSIRFTGITGSWETAMVAGPTRVEKALPGYEYICNCRMFRVGFASSIPPFTFTLSPFTFHLSPSPFHLHPFT